MGADWRVLGVILVVLTGRLGTLGEGVGGWLLGRALLGWPAGWWHDRFEALVGHGLVNHGKDG